MEPLNNSDLDNIYEALNTKGWDLLVQGFTEQFGDCNQIVGCTTLEEMHYRRGRLSVLNELVNLKADIKAQIDDASV